MITEEDIDMVKYFAKEKGDHTRYCKWPEIQGEFEKAFPHFREAVSQCLMAERNFFAVLNSLELEEDDSWA